MALKCDHDLFKVLVAESLLLHTVSLLGAFLVSNRNDSNRDDKK